MTEPNLNLLKHRIAYLREELAKANSDYEFRNGYRAGLQDAVDAMEGRNTLGDPIDPKPRRRR